MSVDENNNIGSNQTTTITPTPAPRLSRFNPLSAFFHSLPLPISKHHENEPHGDRDIHTHQPLPVEDHDHDDHDHDDHAHPEHHDDNSSDEHHDHHDHDHHDDVHHHDEEAPVLKVVNDPVNIPLSAVFCGSKELPIELVKQERTRLKVVLTASLAAFLGPISSTIYSPLITTIEQELNTTEDEVMATVSAYLIISGFMPLLWGPFSDRFGRKTAFLSSTVIYTAFSLASAFSWNINALLAFRVMAAVGASSTLTVGAGAIADTHKPAIRGKAMGYFLLGPLLGPLIGPLIGGVLSDAFGWTSVFYFLTATGVVVFFLIIFFMPETLPPVPTGVKRPFPKPWNSLIFLKYPGILSVTVMAAVSYACFYAVVITFPVIMAEDFGVSVQNIGFYMIISGLGTLLGSILGGRAADFAARGKPTVYRLIVTVSGQACFVPVVFALGWTYEISLPWPIVLGFFNGFFFTFPRSGLTTYAIEEGSRQSSQQSASTITGLIYACMYLLGGVVSQLSVSGRDALGTGWFFTICGALAFLSLLPVVAILFLGIRQDRRQKSLDLEMEGIHA